MDTGHHVAQAEQDLQRCCEQLLDRFGPELARHPLQVRIDGLGSLSDRPKGIEAQVVRVPVPALMGSKLKVLASLLHATVHWVNGLRGIKDCCHRGYHNRSFRALAQEVGFEVGERVHRFGWTDLRPGAELAAELQQIPLDEHTFAPLLAALPEDQGKPRPCRANLLNSQPMSPYWRAKEPLLPQVPRFRVELVREASASLHAYPRVQAGGDAAALLWQVLQGYDREALAVLFLDENRRVIGWDVPYIGILTGAQAEPRGILAPALLANARAVVVGHNHPSGNPRPSRQDERFTHRLQEAGRVLGVELYASITVAGAGQWCQVQPVR